MEKLEIRRVVNAIDAALDVFRRNQDALSVGDVRVQSMLHVLRLELMQNVSRSEGQAEGPTGLVRPAQ